jgi:hypothetical protein
MANKVLLKKSSVSGKVPLTTDLDYGEVALNYADGKLYYKNSSNVISSISSSSGGGTSSIIAIDAKSYTATAAQTTFLVSYAPPFVDVYVNGVHLTSSEYTATNGTSVVLGTSCNAGDEVELRGYSSVAISGTAAAGKFLASDGSGGLVYQTAPTGGGGSTGYTNTYVLTGTTTNATQTEIFVNGVANSRIPIATNVTAYYTMDIAARRTDVVGECAAFYLKSLATNVNGTVSDVGSVYEVVVSRSDTNYLVDLKADNTTKSMTVLVNGVAGKTINWRAVVTTVEV